MGTHWEGFSINPREGFLLRSNIFPDQMRPLASPNRGRIPKRWAMASPRIVGYRGSAHPPVGIPPRKDPERRCAGGWRATGQPAAHSPCGPCRAPARLPGGDAPVPPATTPHGDRPPGTGLSPHRIGRLPLDPGRAPAALDPPPINSARPIPSDGFAAMRARPRRPPDPLPEAGSRL